MEKKSGDNDRREERTKASAASKSTIAGGGGGGSGGGGAPVPGLDPHALFAHSMFGGLPGSFNPLAQLSMLGQSPYGALAPPTSSSASSAYNNASAAAWWSMASQLAAQDYLARLQASTATRGFPGYPGLVPDPLLAAGYDLLAHRTPKQGGSKSSKNQSSSASTSKEASGGKSSKSEASTPSTSNSKASALGSLRLPPDTEIIHYHQQQQQQSSSTPSPAASLADSLQPPPPPKNSSSGRSSNSNSSNSHGKHHHKSTLPSELASVSVTPGSLPTQSSTTTTPKSSLGPPNASMHTSTPNSYYPFLHMPYPFLNTPLTPSTPLPTSDKKSRKSDKETSLDMGANSSTTPVPSSSSSTPRSSTRGQLVNGKPLALDVSSLIAKPSTSASAEPPNDDAPLNLCVKARDESPRPTEEKVRRKPGPKPRTSKPVEPRPPDVPFSALSMFGPSFGLLPKTPDPKVTPPKTSKTNSHSKKNTVASLLAQSRNGSAKSPAPDGNDGRSSSRVSANGDGAASPTDSLSSASHSAFQDLLRAANLSLGQIGALPSASNESTSTNGLGDDMDQDSGDDSSFDDDTDDGEGGSRKRRKFITDETVLRLPLTMGWRRETIIRSLGKSGVRGEVTYFAPCGRRLRQYPDVVRYLERQGIAGITRNNFSFSTRVILGEFIQPIGDNPDRGIRLSEPEVHRLVDQIRAARGWRPRPKRMNTARDDNREEREALARQREAQRAQQRLEAQEMARQAQEAKLQQRMERERALQVAKETRRLLKEQEKQERQEAARRERELRNQQLMEARKKRQEELEKQREEEQLRKIQELNKQRELFYTVELERERRRQHMTLVKALEMRKKFEEREKKKEELRLEKKASKEKRAEERRLELEASKDVKKPVEDMELLDHKPMPKFKRIPGMKLPGKAFADLLMVFEFLHTFGETLGFDMESLPNLDSLQKAMLYDPEAEEELLSVICHLLVCAIEDPGIPHPNRHTTVLGQTLKQADITTNNVSEILRLYLVANALGDAKPPSEKAGNKEVVYENQEAFTLSEWLKHKPFLSLSPSEKGSILSFLIHELLQNKAVIGQIEQSIEGQNTARRDRWIVDSKIRKLKTLHAKKSKSSHSFSKAEVSCEESHEETNQSLQEGKEHKKKEDAEEENDDDDDKDDSGGEEDMHDAENHEEEEDRNLAPEELKKKMERLSRQSNQILTQLTVSDQQLRALALGQDRYRRRYWILPHGGGVFVEACESCEAPAAGFVSWEGLPPPLIQKGLSEDTEEKVKKEEIAAVEEPDKKPRIEPMEMDEPAQKLATTAASTESTSEEKEAKLEEQPDKENIEEPSTAQDAIKQEKQEPKQVDEEEAEERAKTQTAEGQEPLPLQQQQPQQPQQMKLPVISPKKTVPDPDRPWFSILPREPCDDETLASLNAHDMNPIDEPMTPMTDTSERFCADGKNRDHFEAPYARPETPRPVQPMPESLALGWWRITEPDVLKKILESLHPRGVRERELHRLLSRYMDFASDSTSKGDPKCMGLSTDTPDPDPVKLVDMWSRETALRVDLLMLEQIESFEDRIASASMQVKGWKLPSRASCELGYKFRPICELATEENAGTVTPLEIARERLINVEAAIERRYLKAPLGHRVVNGKGEVVLNFLSGGPSLSETPKGLITWREATKKCETAAQLAMCFYMLETSVAWDKSIMKASCQFCHGGDKEDQLLLCDGCDRGYHTYCFKPPMTTIPDGDWFCYECINRAVMERNCIVCGKPGQKNIVFCDACPKAYHIDCLQNPLAKVPRGKWYCQLCQHIKAPPKKKARKSASATVSTPPRDKERVSESEPSTAPANSTPTPTPQTASQESNGEVLGINGNGESGDATRASSPAASIASPPPPPPPPAPPAKKERSAAVAKRNALAKEKDLTPCKVLLDDLEVHDESWPFLLPVNTKQFPTYKKIIKNPMDLSTIRKKLNDGVYKTREEFCADVRLIFHNCEIFNEDDSPVGKAGHSMRVFFDARWPELTGSGH